MQGMQPTARESAAAARADAAADAGGTPGEKFFTVPWSTFTSGQIRELIEEGQQELLRRGQPLTETETGKAARMKSMLDPECEF